MMPNSQVLNQTITIDGHFIVTDSTWTSEMLRKVGPLVMSALLAFPVVGNLTSDGGQYVNTESLWHAHQWDGTRLFAASPDNILYRTNWEDRPAYIVRWIAEASGLSLSELARLLDVTRQTIHNWLKDGPASRRHYTALKAVQGILQRAARNLGSLDEVRIWLQTPVGSSGVKPITLLSDGDYDRVRYLAIASPSASVSAAFETREDTPAPSVWPWASYYREPSFESTNEPIDDVDPDDEW
jgi:transcriptional regulator with XRE-family HTH domain